jgi:hypothetical protein
MPRVIRRRAAGRVPVRHSVTQGRRGLLELWPDLASFSCLPGPSAVPGVSLLIMHISVLVEIILDGAALPYLIRQ